VTEPQVTAAPEEGANGDQVAETLGRTTVSKSFYLGTLARQWELTSDENRAKRSFQVRRLSAGGGVRGQTNGGQGNEALMADILMPKRSGSFIAV
jgi:hypothetical protein